MSHSIVKGISLALLCLSALAGCRGEPMRKPPIHLNQNMDLQDKYKPQRTSDLFEDGRSMRPPVEGTVGRELLATAYGVKTEGLADHDDRYLREDDAYWRGLNEDGSKVDAIPESVKVDEALLARGEQRYNIYCSPCHGLTGSGDGMVNQVGKLNVPSYHQDYMRQYEAGHIYGVISNGQGRMKGYKHQIPTKDRWAIVAYVRALQHSQAVAAKEER
jgi:mono/diheme cytochrome c family protein